MARVVDSEKVSWLLIALDFLVHFQFVGVQFPNRLLKNSEFDQYHRSGVWQLRNPTHGEWVDYSDPAYKEMLSKFENPAHGRDCVKNWLESIKDDDLR